MCQAFIGKVSFDERRVFKMQLPGLCPVYVYSKAHRLTAALACNEKTTNGVIIWPLPDLFRCVASRTVVLIPQLAILLILCVNYGVAQSSTSIGKTGYTEYEWLHSQA